MEYFLGDVLFGTGVPVVFLGREASRFEKHLAPMTWKFHRPHPASASYNLTRWETEGLFTKLNKILDDSNGTKIQWMKTE
jgi:uracil DNA glycosylase